MSAFTAVDWFAWWGSDCEDCGNTTEGSMVCDECGTDAHTIPLFRPDEGDAA